MSSKDSSIQVPPSGDPSARVIRPADQGDGVLLEDRHFKLENVDLLVQELQRKSQGRLDALRRSANELEQKLRQKTAQSRARIEEAMQVARESIAARIEETAQRSQEIFEERHREGFEKGKEEGYQRGFEEGLETGLQKGLEEGRKQGETSAREEVLSTLGEATSTVAPALHDLLQKVDERWEKLFEDAHRELVELALDLARQVIHTELREVSADTVTACFESALDRIVQSEPLTVEIHPRDRSALESHVLETHERLQQCQALTIVENEELQPGGCILRSGDCIVDQTIRSQFDILEQRVRTATGGVV